MLSLILHKCLELQINEINTSFGSLTIVNHKVDGLFSDLIFANRISVSVCHIS